MVSLLAVVCLGFFLWSWEQADSSLLEVYFDRPSDAVNYIQREWGDLLLAMGGTLAVAGISLLLSLFCAWLALTISLLLPKARMGVESVAVVSQTVPMVVTVTLVLLTELIVFSALGWKPLIWVYAVAPVTVALSFPPVIAGFRAVKEIPLELKLLIDRISAPKRSKVKDVYLPHITPYLLDGMRVSSTWAIVATLITEGMIGPKLSDSGL